MADKRLQTAERIVTEWERRGSSLYESFGEPDLLAFALVALDVIGYDPKVQG